MQFTLKTLAILAATVGIANAICPGYKYTDFIYSRPTLTSTSSASALLTLEEDPPALVRDIFPSFLSHV